MTVGATNKSESGLTTRALLLRAAERLFAEQGVGRTSTRAILREAGQRNESALQYHFGGREGLIEALYSERGAEVSAERERMLADLAEHSGPPTIRQLCEVALMPPVRLAKKNPEFLEFLKVVGQLAFVPNQKLKENHQRYELDSVAKVSDLIRKQLDLPAELTARRFELIYRMSALSLAQRARNGGSFDGPNADLYFATVLDAMASILSGGVSPETTKCLEASRKKS